LADAIFLLMSLSRCCSSHRCIGFEPGMVVSSVSSAFALQIVLF